MLVDIAVDINNPTAQSPFLVDFKTNIAKFLLTYTILSVYCSTLVGRFSLDWNYIGCISSNIL